jgi:hypothetical protein
VHADRSVTFTLRAPEATDGKVSGDFTQNSPTTTKYLDGTWTATAGSGHILGIIFELMQLWISSPF